MGKQDKKADQIVDETMKEIAEKSLACIELHTADMKRAAYVLEDKLGLEQFRVVEEGVVRIYDTKISVQELTKTLALNDVPVTGVGERSETLEEYFLKITEGVQI